MHYTLEELEAMSNELRNQSEQQRQLKKYKAIAILETLQRQAFADWYTGRFDEYISDGGSKEVIIQDIIDLFKL